MTHPTMKTALDGGNRSKANVRSADKASLNESFIQVKEFYTLRARAARVGHAVWRSDSADGDVQFFSSKWGLVKRFGTLRELEAFVRMIGG